MGGGRHSRMSPFLPYYPIVTISLSVQLVPTPPPPAPPPPPPLIVVVVVERTYLPSSFPFPPSLPSLEMALDKNYPLSYFTYYSGLPHSTISMIPALPDPAETQVCFREV